MDAAGRQTVVADLRLCLYLRTLHPEFFNIRARRVFRHGSVEFEVWLLDAGHVITFVDSGEAVTEALVPRELELPRRGLARTLDIVGEHEHRLEARGPVVYHMAYQVDAADPPTYRREVEELLARAGEGHLLPEEPREAARRPFSYAIPEAKGRGLLVHTWHGFPAESTLLKTQTLIERTGP